MSRVTHMKNILSQMQANVPVPNFQYFQLPNLSSNLAEETFQNSVYFELDQISVHSRELHLWGC